MMTFLTLQRNPNFKCAVLVGAISNVEEYAITALILKATMRISLEKKD